MSNPHRDNGGTLPAGLNLVANNAGLPEPIHTRLEWNAIPGRTGHGPTIEEYVNQLYKLTDHIIVWPLVKVRKIGNFWLFKCSHCPDYSVSPYWKLIYRAADRHARKEHRR